MKSQSNDKPWSTRINADETTSILNFQGEEIAIVHDAKIADEIVGHFKAPRFGGNS